MEQQFRTMNDKMQQYITPITNNPYVDTLGKNVENLNNTISSTGESLKTGVQNTLDQFSSKSLVNSSNEFLQSNSLIAKFAFLILILILFVFLFSLGMKLMGYFTKPSNSPYIVKGLVTGSKNLTISQDPASSTSVTISRSNNNKSGIEFTWSVWLYVLKGNGDVNSHVFNKGNSSWGTDDGIASVNNGPGLYLTKSEGTMGLKVVMDTENSESSSVEIGEIPLQKWFNVCIRMQNIIMDVYVNGTNSGRLILPAVPRQNYNDVNVCHNGGFDGNLSDLRYFDHALSVFEINSLIFKGPDLNTSTSSSTNGTTMSNGTNYLSKLWYFNHI
jgi:hypothetical protein